MRFIIFIRQQIHRPDRWDWPEVGAWLFVPVLVVQNLSGPPRLRNQVEIDFGEEQHVLVEPALGDDPGFRKADIGRAVDTGNPPHRD